MNTIRRWRVSPICNRGIAFLTLACCLNTEPKTFAQDFWQQANGPHNGNVVALACNSSEQVFAGTFEGLFRSTDDGINWQLLDIGSDNVTRSIYSLAVDSNDHLFAGSYASVFRSMDGGENWVKLSNGLADALLILSLAINNANGHLFAGSKQGVVFRSIDNGESWTRLESGLSNNTDDVLTLAINANGQIFAGTFDGVLRSTDDGDHWTQINNGILYEFDDIFSLAISNQGHLFAGSYFEGVYRSTDNGDHWEAAKTALTSTGIVSSLVFNADGHLFAGMEGITSSLGADGMFFSIDNGENWAQINSGLSNTNVAALAASSSGTVFAGTLGSGVYRSAGSITSLKEMAESTPTAFSLKQNYPNPFNPETTIRFSLPKASFVMLKIFNVLGEEVATLVNQELHAGVHRVIFNAHDLPGSVYFCQMRAGNFVQQRKLVVVK